MKFFLGIALLLSTLFSFSQEVAFTIAIDNLESEAGSVIVSVFKDQQTFADETPAHVFHLDKQKYMTPQGFRATLTLPAGVYGIALVDDADSDREMDFSWMGLPQEGYGFSNYYHTGISRPSFEDFAFTLNSNTGTLSMKMKYL